MDDGAWHTAIASRSAVNEVTLRVDAVDAFAQANPSCHNSAINTANRGGNGAVYIGGHPAPRGVVCDPTVAQAQGCTPGQNVGSGDPNVVQGRHPSIASTANYAGCLSGIRYEQTYETLGGPGVGTTTACTDANAPVRAPHNMDYPPTRWP